MKLLFDENLSPKLTQLLAKEYPGSAHACQLGLRAAEDRKIWQHARENGFAIVSKDTDFRERSLVEGFPPKVVWLDVGNAGTRAIAALLRRQVPRVERFAAQDESSFLILTLGSGAI